MDVQKESTAKQLEWACRVQNWSVWKMPSTVKSMLQAVNLFILHTQKVWRLKHEHFYSAYVDRYVKNPLGDMGLELSGSLN